MTTSGRLRGKQSRANRIVEEVRAQERIIGAVAPSTAQTAIVELLVEIRDILKSVVHRG